MSVRGWGLWGKVETLAHRAQPQETRGWIENRMRARAAASIGRSWTRFESMGRSVGLRTAPAMLTKCITADGGCTWLHASYSTSACFLRPPRGMTSLCSPNLKGG